MRRRWPAEWEQQDGVLLAWPHAETDWKPWLERVEPVFAEISAAVSRFERLVVISPEPHRVRELTASAGAVSDRIDIYEIPTNDTWSRDFGPITVMEGDRPLLIDCGFNGWGLKFPADLDNQVTRRLYRTGCFGRTPVEASGLILEGGSIESDGRGTVLTTAQCLLSANRNPHLSRAEIEDCLGVLLGAKHILWLESGYLAGDDTDSHIDTLVRLCPNDTILHVACDDEKDEHYSALARMSWELASFRTPERRPYRLIPLPWPSACFNDEGERLPATYANYLVINGAVLMPTYGDPRDAEALEAVGEAFPDREIIGIDCRPLILQHGSLHCVTMQLPKGVLGRPVEF